MKHLKYLILPVLAASLLAGCGDTSTIDRLAEENSAAAATTEAASQPETKSPEQLEEPTVNTTASSTAGTSPDTLPPPADGEVLDLTQLSASMVYGQVYDMVYNSDEYVGKTVKVHGPFSYFKDASTGNEYFAVLITDAMACCSQGIEFVLAGEHTYPDDYPLLDTEITVVGTFNYYKEGGNTYCQLTNAEMLTDNA